MKEEQFLMFFDLKNILDYVYEQNALLIKVVADRFAELSSRKFPLLFFIDYNEEQTFFYRAVKDHDIQKIHIFLNLVTVSYANPYSNFAIDRRILDLLQQQINMTEYFKSELVFPKIETELTASLINEKQIIGLNYENYGQLMREFDQIIEKEESKYKKEDSKLISLSNKEISNVPNAKFFVNNYIVNIPETIKNHKFINNLIKYNYEDIYESFAIQSILEYKWKTYCEKYFLQELILYFLFLAILLIDIYFFVLLGDERSFIQQIILKICGWIFTCKSIYYEYKSLKNQRRDYFKDYFNLIDILVIVNYLLTSIIDIQNLVPDGVVILYSMLLLECFFKLISILRQFKEFNFLVSMLLNVFKDLRYFILLYGMVIIVYGLIFNLLQINPDPTTDYYQGISLAGYFIMAFRASIGDFQVDNFNILDDSVIIFAWIIWVTSVLILNVILLNFIIAVISSSYEKVLQNKTQQQFKLLAQLINERESNFSEKDREKFFPRFLLVRQPVDVELSDNVQWEGFVKDLKRSIKKLNTRMDAKDKLDSEKNENILKEMKNIQSQIASTQDKKKEQKASTQDMIQNMQEMIKGQSEQIKSLIEKN